MVNRVSTSHAPQKPSGRRGSAPTSPSGPSSSPPGDSAAVSASAPTNEGNTSGSAASVAHSRRSGRSVRVVSQASPVPATALESAAATASTRELRSGSSVAGDV